MLIHQLNNFLKEASFLPISFWINNYFLAKKSFASQLINIIKGTNQETDSSQNLANLIHTLKKDEVDEYELAELFQALSRIFLKSKIEDKYLKIFENLSLDFFKRAKANNHYKEVREDLQKTLPEEKQKEHDFKLFQNEGVSYCLEYYLAVYKQLEDLTSEEEKELFIKSNEISLGFGKLPGLKQDFKNDESLIKFIYSILDDKTREELIEAYYKCKIVIHKETNSEKIKKALKRYVLFLLVCFEEQGIKNLTSTFLIPYGKKPEIIKLIELFE